MDQVEKRIQKVFGQHTNAFKNLLEITGAVISGSFIIQAILDETWDKSDIDVFIPIRNMKSPSDNPSSEIEEWLLNDVKTPIKDYYAACRYGDNMAGGHHIKWIRNFKLNGSIIQLVHVDVTADKITQYILNSFDFSICKNVYSVGKLIVTDMGGILTKTFNFAYAGNIFGSIRRMQKYSERGFKIAFNKRKLITSIIKNQDDDSEYFLKRVTRDISQHDQQKYRIWPNNIFRYNVDEEKFLADIFSNRSTKIRVLDDNPKKCTCPFSFLTHFHTEGKHLGHGACQDLVVFNDPAEQDLKKTAKLSKRLKILCSMPKYIKMDILETTTELTLWELYNLIN
jgi:predicted nucleotidyltransferase